MLSLYKFLVVDDTKFMRVKTIKILTEKGASIANIVEAENGREAMQVLKRHLDVDFILCDLNMPVRTGLEFLEDVRSSKDEKIAKKKFILVTTDSEKDKVITALKLKVNGYVLKVEIEEKLVDELIRTLGAA
jgi:DNA-binding NarL/FixJ family response regulator